MRRLILGVMTAAVLFPLTGFALTGNEWNALSTPARQAYIVGVVDTWENVALSHQATKEVPNIASNSMVRLSNCLLKGMTYGQVYAIVERYMVDNPSMWHYGMSSNVWTAIDKACPAT